MEDKRILTGRGQFVDDLRLPRMVHAAFLRSPVPHALLTSVDVTAARQAPGVVAVLTAEDLHPVLHAMPVSMAGATAPVFHALASDRVRYVGDPIVMVLAGNRHEAEDATELVEIEYEPLPTVATYEAALDPTGPALFDDLPDNVAAIESASFGDIDQVMAEADQVIEFDFDQARVAPVPMETRGAVGMFDPGAGELTLHCNVQTPHALRLALSQAMSLPLEQVRVIVSNDMGGGFGLKSSFGRETFAVAGASRLLGRPVKWTEDRYEHLLSSGHAREEKVSVAIGVKDDGTLLGLRAKVVLDQGAYPSLPFPSTIITGLIKDMLPGPYKWRAYSYEKTTVRSNKATYVAYRGPWAVETWVRERSLDEVARKLGIDPGELRRHNGVEGAADDRLISGNSLAGVTSKQSLVRALERIGYDEFRKEQEGARAEGRYIGIGFATFIESAPGPADRRAFTAPFMAESARVKLGSDGHLLVITSQVPHGQSHETTLAQLVADEMGVPFDHVKVEHGDTRTAPFKFTGTGGSMASTWASGAAIVSTRKVKEKVLAIASDMLEISPEDLEITDGVVVAKGAPAKSLPLAQIAMAVMMSPDTLPPGADRMLEAEERFKGDGITGSGWSGGTHACTVEVDVRTGAVKILRYVVIEDCGRVINPAVVEGQIRGGVAQGIGEVLYERAAYDEEGNYLAATFMDYLLPTASEIPDVEIEHLESDPEGEFGFRGVGEGGAIVAPPTVGNAIADALAPFGATILDQYLPPARILELAGVIEPET